MPLSYGRGAKGEGQFAAQPTPGPSLLRRGYLSRLNNRHADVVRLYLPRPYALIAEDRRRRQRPDRRQYALRRVTVDSRDPVVAGSHLRGAQSRQVDLHALSAALSRPQNAKLVGRE